MAAVSRALSILKKEEQILAKKFEQEVTHIRSAIASLMRSGASAVSPRRGRPAGSKNAKTEAPVKARRKLSAKARKAISLAQKKRWAVKKAGEKK